jgi:hypothetical protein
MVYGGLWAIKQIDHYLHNPNQTVIDQSDRQEFRQ